MEVVEFLDADLSNNINIDLLTQAMKTYTGWVIQRVAGNVYPYFVTRIGEVVNINGRIRGIVKYADGSLAAVEKRPDGYDYRQVATIGAAALFKARVLSDRCTVKALNAMPDNLHEYIKVKNQKYQFGVPPVVSFTIQSDPVSEVGTNGCQVSDMLEYVKNLFIAADEAFPCDENKQTILKLK